MSTSNESRLRDQESYIYWPIYSYQTSSVGNKLNLYIIKQQYKHDNQFWFDFFFLSSIFKHDNH